MKKSIAIILLSCLPVFATVPANETIQEFKTCNGSVTTFTFTISCKAASEIQVWKKFIATNVGVLLVQDIDYTISMTDSTDGDYYSGGVVTISPAPASTYQIVLVRKTTQTQEMQSGSVNPISIEAGFDKTERQIQDLQYGINRSLRLPESEANTPMFLPSLEMRKGLGLAFDANGEPYGAATYDYRTYPTNNYTQNYTINLPDANDANALIVRTAIDAERKFQINVKDAPYSAKGDGITDDTIAIQAAIDVCYNANGGTVYFPEGTYLGNINKIFHSYAKSIRFLGAGMGITTVKAYTAAPVFDLGGDGDANTNINVWFENITIDGNSHASHGVKLTASAFNRFENVQIQDCNKGAWLRGGIYSDFRECMLDNNIDGYYQEYFAPYSPNLNKITGGRIADNSRFGIFADTGRFLMITNVGIEGNGTWNDSNTAPIKLQRMTPAAGTAGPSAVISGCYIEANRGKASIWAVDCNAIGGLVIRDTLSADANTDYGLYLDSCKIYVDNFTMTSGTTSWKNGERIKTVDCNGLIFMSKALSVSINSNVVQFPLMMGAVSDYQYFSNQWNFLKVREGLLIGANNATSDGMLTRTSLLDVNSIDIRVRNTRTPASASAAGYKGTICWDASYIYVCTDVNTWERTAISSW